MHNWIILFQFGLCMTSDLCEYRQIFTRFMLWLCIYWEVRNIQLYWNSGILSVVYWMRVRNFQLGARLLKIFLTTCTQYRWNYHRRYPNLCQFIASWNKLFWGYQDIVDLFLLLSFFICSLGILWRVASICWLRSFLLLK